LQSARALDCYKFTNRVTLLGIPCEDQILSAKEKKQLSYTLLLLLLLVALQLLLWSLSTAHF